VLWLSEGHYRLPNGSWSGGSSFLVVKQKQLHGDEWIGDYVSEFTNYGHVLTKGLSYVGLGPPPAVPALSYASQEIQKAKAFYSTGVNRTKPGRPEASLGQFLIELRDLPKIPLQSLWWALTKAPLKVWPRIILSRLKKYRSLGNEYLNVEFGWAPFIRDLRKVFYLMVNIDKRLAQIVRDNGRSIRRKATLSETSSITMADAGTVPRPFERLYRIPPSTGAPGSSSYYCYDSTSEKVWFSAAYRYWVPDVQSWGWNARARLALFGALPTPELLWEVLPWSWLIDWFSNVGDVIANVSDGAVDNLVFLYSFVMMESKTTRVAICDVTQERRDLTQLGSVRTHVPACVHRFRSERETVIKRRVGGGNPFGLDVGLSSLSGRQLGILAALGISRGMVR